jgi:hypothetical protein
MAQINYSGDSKQPSNPSPGGGVMNINAEFSQLIKLLSEINKLNSEEAQLEAIELRLVEAELNPCIMDFVEIKHALKVLSKINLVDRDSVACPEELGVYF